MAPKKVNGFWLFALDWKKTHGNNMTPDKASAGAGEVWKHMSERERAPYVKRAKEENSRQKGGGGGKLTCTGKPISFVENEALESEMKEKAMKADIQATVHSSKERGELANQTYLFIMVNYFTKTMRDNEYIPAELSIAEFSLKDGVTRKYHTCVNPMVDIYGHQYEAQKYSETTHNLPLPPNAMGESNLGRIFQQVLDFARNKDTGTYPPVYTTRDAVPIVESVLAYMQSDLSTVYIQPLKVYPIQYLFYVMKMCTSEISEAHHTIYITDAIFERDFFEYQTGIACEYHEEHDKSKYCTQSYVTRWGYMFADYMCGDLEIQLLPDRHVPRSTNLNAIINPPALNSCLSDTFDTRSIASFGSSRGATSNVTKPIYENKVVWDADHDVASVRSQPSFDRDLKDDFPSLDAHSQRARKKHANNTTSVSGRNIDLSNPWGARPKQPMPKEPCDKHFDIDFSRGEVSESDEFNSVASFGRGNARGFFKANNKPGVGHGRGYAFQ